jgi:hypothetical protein
MSISNMNDIHEKISDISAKERFVEYYTMEEELHLIRHFQELDEDYITSLIERKFFNNREEIFKELQMAASKFYSTLWKNPKELLNDVKDKITGMATKTDLWNNDYYEIRLGQGVGYLNVVNKSQLDNLTLSNLYLKERSGFNAWHVSTNDQFEATTFTLVMNDAATKRIKTAFPGEYAPPFPNVKNNTKEQYDFAKDYWENHVFLVPSL